MLLQTWRHLPGATCRGTGAGAPLPRSQGGDNPGQQSRATIPFSSMSQFNLDFNQGVKAKVPLPQFLLNHCWDNPHYESRCGSRLQRDVREPNAVYSFHQMGALHKLALLCCVFCTITPTAKRLSKYQRSVQHLRYRVCVFTHTQMCRSHGRSSFSHWRAKFSGRTKQRKGRQSGPLWRHMRPNSKSARLSFVFLKGRAGYLVLVLHLTRFLANGGP